MLELRVLGPLEVVRDRRAVPVGRAKERALLALLVLHVNETVPTDRLVDALWDRPPESARASLHAAVSRLRGVLGDEASLVSRPPGYALLLDDVEAVDEVRFAHLVDDGRAALDAGDAAQASACLRQALAMWRGDALADVADAPLARPAITRLEELRLVALEHRVDADLALGHHATLVAELTALVAAHPLRERLHAQLILALYRSGQQAAALAAYSRLRALLGDELGIDPSPDLRELEEAVLHQEPRLAWSRPRQDTGPPPPPSVPVALTSFVGREREVARVAELLTTSRHVTLTGAGGCGKTRLAFETAGRQADARDGRVRVVELAPVAGDSPVEQAVARALGVREEPGRSVLDSLADHLSAPHTLLVLDTCEHLADACAVLTEQLLRACPALQILATSRQPLRAAGETTWRVPSLSTPPVDTDLPLAELERRYEAVRLFLERARAAAPDQDLSSRDGGLVASLCRRLDGMPLALELAAACTRVLPVAEVARRLDDRFQLLVGGNRTAPPRQQTLRATVDWSWALLPVPEQETLTRLAVFAGWFAADAALAVCAGDAPGLDVDAVLCRLADASLLVVEERQSPRYRLPDTVREYGRERLAAAPFAPETRACHARYYLGEAEAAASGLRGPDSGAWLHRLRDDHEELRAAMAWSLTDGDAESALRLAGALWRYAYLRGSYEEGSRWLSEALARAPDASVRTVAQALYGAAALAFYRCEYESAVEHCGEALVRHRSTGELSGVADVLTLLGAVARERGRYTEALEFHRQAGLVFEELSDRWGAAHSLQMAGFAAWLSGDFDTAEDASGRSLAVFRDLGDKERQAWALLDLGAVALYRGDLPRAELLLQQSHDLSTDLGFQEGVAWALNLRGVAAGRQGEWARARTLLQDSLELHRGLGDRWRVASVLDAMAGAVRADGDLVRAARLLAAADALRDVLGVPVPTCERGDLDRVRAAVRSAQSPVDVARATAEGQAAVSGGDLSLERLR